MVISLFFSEIIIIFVRVLIFIRLFSWIPFIIFFYILIIRIMFFGILFLIRIISLIVVVVVVVLRIQIQLVFDMSLITVLFLFIWWVTGEKSKAKLVAFIFLVTILHSLITIVPFRFIVFYLFPLLAVMGKNLTFGRPKFTVQFRKMLFEHHDKFKSRSLFGLLKFFVLLVARCYRLDCRYFASLFIVGKNGNHTGVYWGIVSLSLRFADRMFLVVPAVNRLFLQVTGRRRRRSRTILGQNCHSLFIGSRLDKLLKLDAAVDALPDSCLFGLPRFHLSPIAVVEAMTQLNVFAAPLLLHLNILSFYHLIVFVLTFTTAGE